MVSTLIDEYGYNEDSAEEVIKFAANNLWRDSQTLKMNQVPEKINLLEKFVGNTPSVKIYCTLDDKEITILAKVGFLKKEKDFYDFMVLNYLK